MKIIATHKSPDMDGITSIWLLKHFLQGWENAEVAFVPVGEKLKGNYENEGDVIEKVDGNDAIHVDIGLGKFDHHQIDSNEVSAASLVYDYVLKEGTLGQDETKKEAIRRMVNVVVDDDYFQEVYFEDALSHYHDFSLFKIIDGFKLQKQGDDQKCVEFITICLDSILHIVENRVWAEKEIKEKGIEFDTKWGKAIGLETINDKVLELAQKMGYIIAVRKDPHSGRVRIKTLPKPSRSKVKNIKGADVDLTPIYEKIKNIDPEGFWYLHISKKMLLNGSTKNPNMKPTPLSLSEIISIIKKA